jgi:hypothetical protein
MDEDYYKEEKEFTISYGQLEQLGPRQREGLEGIAQAINSGEGMSAALRKAGQMRIDPIDRFKILCSIYYDKLGGDKSFIVGWDKIISKIPLIKWAQYKNPIGFVLGARIIGKDRVVEGTRLDFTCSGFKETMKTESISKEDVLRYGRYWETILKSD